MQTDRNRYTVYSNILLDEETHDIIRKLAGCVYNYIIFMIKAKYSDKRA